MIRAESSDRSLLRGGPRPSLLEGFFEPVPVDGAEVEQGLGLAVGDQVLVGGDRLVEELLDLPITPDTSGRSVYAAMPSARNLVTACAGG